MQADSPSPDRRGHRNLIVLAAATAILGSQLPVAFILGGLSGQVLASNKCFSTLPITMIVLGSALSAPVLSALMQRHGRRVGFVIGALCSAAGAAICAAALWLHLFPLFLAGSFLTGVYQSAQGFFRFAAIDSVTEARRPRAISFVLAAGLLPAIGGPLLVKLTEDALAPTPFAGAYAAVFLLNLIGVWVFAWLDIPRPPPATASAAPIRSRAELLRLPAIQVAMITAMVSYALMNLVMTSTPLSMKGCGFATDDAANVVSAHVLGMYAPSFVTGWLISRLGVTRIMGAGLLIMALAGAVALHGTSLTHFYLALILLGVGWNFGFIGATTLLASAHRPEERGRVQGMNDFAVFGMVTLASMSSGGLLNCSGGSAVEGWHLVNLTMAPLLLLAGAVLLRHVLRASRAS